MIRDFAEILWVVTRGVLIIAALIAPWVGVAALVQVSSGWWGICIIPLAIVEMAAIVVLVLPPDPEGDSL